MIMHPLAIGILLSVLSTIVEAQLLPVPTFQDTTTGRCSFTNSTLNATVPRGGTPVPDPDESDVDTVEKCQKHCTMNLHQNEVGCFLKPKCNLPCEFAVFRSTEETGPKCLLYPVGLNVTGKLKQGETLIIAKSADGCPPLSTTSSIQTTEPVTDTEPTTSPFMETSTETTTTTTTTTPPPMEVTIANVVTTVAVGDPNPQCCEWAKKGECDVNPYYMKINCKISCGTPTASVNNANTIASNPSADCKPTSDVNACKDENTDCSKWALDKQCVVNPYFMLVKCASACRKCEGGTPKTLKNACGDTDQPAIQGCANSKDECNFWASIGECKRNAAWMPTGCCAACRNIATIFQNCPLAGKAPFTGEG